MKLTQRYCHAASITSGLLHLWGAFLAIAGSILLLVCSSTNEEYVSASIYGLSLVGLFSASAIFHIFYISERVHRILQKIDHSLIFCLIAGTYTPVCLLVLADLRGMILFVAIWTLALVGILGKIFWFSHSQWFSTIVYLLMGWGIVFFLKPISGLMTSSEIFFLVAGGLSYTVGAIAYAAKSLQFNHEQFGSHELFHIFVLIGAACHFYMIYQLFI